MSVPENEKVKKIIDALERKFGIPELEGRSDPLGTLIGTILSQNTNDTNSDRAYSSLREKFPEWEDLLDADPKDIADAIRVGGLANQKAITIKEVLRWIKDTYGKLNLDFICDMDTEEVIRTFTSLKGIGPKTVNVMLLFACGRDVFPVDTHIHRVSGRLGLIPPKTSREKAHELMAKTVPEGKSYSFHINLINFGRTVCGAQNPKCHICPLFDDCTYDGRFSRKTESAKG